MIKEIKNDEVQSLHLFIPDYEIVNKYFTDEEYYYRTFIEGLSLGNYTFDKFKKKLLAKNVTADLHRLQERNTHLAPAPV